MKNLFQKKRNIFFLTLLLLISSNSIQPLFAQQSSEPPSGFMAGQACVREDNQGNGLLFYLSGKNDFTADFANGGQVEPNFLKDVTMIPDGAIGKGFSADDSQLMTYWAPGNIYAQRGNISFFWRSRYPVGPTPFPIFRVSYADHSSWDMVWLRIDYNGSGFDAFVTDIGLTRTRVSYSMDKFPEPDEWVHLSLSWDETEGIRFYVNGQLAEKKSIVGNIYDTGLDQFGPHSRIISPYQVQSAYCFMRGGDLDELKIYDRMLPDNFIADLANGRTTEDLAPLERNLSERRWRDAWWMRHGWNLPNPAPPTLPSSQTSIRKIEIHDAVDIKRWYWKANDGIRETTWPGVYNMSRLPGRYDYFVLPDWDCYSGSGQSIRFNLPDEPWNHVEMWGKAWGQLTLEDKLLRDTTFAVRTQKQIKSYNRLNTTKRGGTIRFDNALIEEPIGSFEVYNVDKGSAPKGSVTESFTLTSAPATFNDKSIEKLASFVCGRYPADERTMMLGIPEGSKTKSAKKANKTKFPYPFIHILIPYSDQNNAGLDGIEIKFPPMNVKPTHEGVFPLNIRVKDPLWEARDLTDFSFSVKPGESPTLWIDTRNRVLPKEHALYITIAGAGADLTPELLEGTQVRLVYESKENSRPEHEIDRLTQVRDLYAHMVEERPRFSRLNVYNRLTADLNDLLSVNPDNQLGKIYNYAITRRNKPDFEIPKCPEGIPEWAFLQTEYLRQVNRFIMYYIDKRQISNGEFGGGLSDDGDLLNLWPAVSFLGIEPDKILKSLQLHMDAYYDNDRPAYDAPLRQRSLPLFTNGLATIFTDELHAVEDGMQVVGAMEILDYGNPLHIERGMHTASRMLKDITKINPKGHRHFCTRFYSGTRIATEDPWQWSVPRSYNVLQTSFLTSRYNGNPKLQKMILEIADGLIEHIKDGKMNTQINFETDEDKASGRMGGAIPESVFHSAYQISGDKNYLKYVSDNDPSIRFFDKDRIANRYKEEISNMGIFEYINTEGSTWIDRTTYLNSIIQKDRLGGIALMRLRNLLPLNIVSWNFNKPEDYDDVAIFVNKAMPDSIGIIAYNLDTNPIDAAMTVWDITPGKWMVREGIDTNDDQIIDSELNERIVDLERGEAVDIKFSSRAYKIISLELIESAAKGYWERPDLGIGTDDVQIKNNEVIVKVHSLGAVATPATTIELKDAAGNLVASAPVPPLEAPLDLKPRWIEIIISIPEGTDLKNGCVEIDPKKETQQISRKNTIVEW